MGARLARLDGAQGAGEQRTEAYMQYGEGAAQPATPQSVKSSGRVSGFAQDNGGAPCEPGFVMPTIIILMVIMASVAYATLVQANNGLNLSYKQAYIQMARSASKAAVDYAQEQFNNANCGSYSGTAETNLTGASNTRYRITMQAEVTNTSPDGFEKTIKGTGRIYLPKASSSALYVFDIRSEIVRTYAVCKTPDNFGPLVWLDASDITTLRKTNDTDHLDANTAFGSSGDSTRDTLEERVDNGQQGGSSWSSNDLQMHSCSAAEFSASICNDNATKYLYSGIVFENVNIARNSTIVAAIMSARAASQGGISGSLTHRVCGIYETSTNPHKARFSSGGTGQIRSRIQTANLHTAACQDTTTNNFPPGDTINLDITSVLQEIVNNANWNPATGRLGLAVYRLSGTGSRTVLKDNIRLSVNYNRGSSDPADDGETVRQWNDKSPNQYNAKLVYGNAPTRLDNQINGKTIVRFNNSAFVSSLSRALSGKREFTAFAVLKPNFGTSAATGRVISGMTTSGTDDTSGTNGIIPLRRQNNATGFSNYYANSASYEAIMGCNPACASTPYLATSWFHIDTTDNTITATLRGNGGAQSGQKTGINPGSPPPPYTFGIDQLYWGGRRTGAMPGAGIDYFNGDYAELVVYDKALSCHEIENLEEYFRNKWAINPTAWTDNCPPNTIPTL